MLNKFRDWYLRNYEAITWFIIGFLVMSALVNFSQGDIAGAMLSLAIATVNYIFVKKM